tara:strand:+ start:573 stop:749 length:177 start_codon:yes stop_codon:yes gene_type:complete
MSGLSQLDQTTPVLRKANIEDFMDCIQDDIHKQHNQNHNEDYDQKNQRNYGHRKRIKP